MIVSSWDADGCRGGHFPTNFSNFSISNVACVRAEKTAISAAGLPDMKLEGVVLRNVTVDQAKTAARFGNTEGFAFTGVTVNGKAVPAP